jgi:NAD(P)-dependent dehydrogenase (short-subunit alcohol dehydrogenase family)
MSTSYPSLIALVTGGSRGIGLATAAAFVSRGMAVAITGTDAGHLEAARASLAAGGGRVLALQADVRRAGDVQGAVERVASAFGGLDVLVNNAGVGGFVEVASMQPDQWHRVIDTNLTGVYHCCHAAIPHLKARGGGWIINVSSLAGSNAFVGGAAYCASKAGLNAFSESLMQEVRHDGIRVSCVAPGSVRTGFSSSDGPGTEWKLAPEDVAQVVVDLIGHPARSLPSRVEIRPSRPPRK